MIDLTELKKRADCIFVLRHLGYRIPAEGGRMVSPLRADASNKTSFSVNKDFWYDFGSGMGGDSIDLYAELACDADKSKAIKELSKIVGIQQENYPTGWKSYMQNFGNGITLWHTQLMQPENKHIIDYLHSRRITDETIKRLSIGFNDNRIIFPYIKNGYFYNYIARTAPGSAPESASEPRYKKPANNKFSDPTPWGMHTLTRKSETLYIAEGTFDALSIEQSGYPVIATMGGHFSKSVVQSVINICKEYATVCLTFDNDDRGKQFTADFSMLLFKNKIKFTVASIPEPFKDISDYYAAGNEIADLTVTDGLTHLISSFEHATDFRDFIMQASRFCDRLTIASLIESATQFSKRELKAIDQAANACPLESKIADEIIAEHQLIYIDQVGFYLWNGYIWEKRTDVYIRQLADIQYGKFFATAQRCNAVCNLLKARTLVNIAFDRKPVLTFLNGTLELETGIFRKSYPEDYCSIQMQYSYDINADCPKWKQFIIDITEDPIREEILQYIAGYVLFPDCRHQKIFALIGDGGNGKSVYLEVLQKLYGDDNCSNVDPLGLMEDFKCIHIKDSLLNVSSEIDADFSKAEKIIKKVSAGEECMACYKGMTHVKFYPRCKLVYACNEIPRASVVKGMDRRLIFIEFPCRFVDTPNKNNPLEKRRDLNIIPKLLKELPGIFNWAYEGYKGLLEQGYFTETLEQNEIMQRFKELSNPVSAFVDDYEWTGEMTREQIYNRYASWCQDTGHRQQSVHTFFPTFRELVDEYILQEGRKRINGKNLRYIIFKEDNKSTRDNEQVRFYWTGKEK